MKVTNNFHLFLIDLSKAQNSFCGVLKDFTLNYIGEIDTPDEIEIGLYQYFFRLTSQLWQRGQSSEMHGLSYFSTKDLLFLILEGDDIPIA